MRKICVDFVCVPVSESRPLAISQQRYVQQLKNLLGRTEEKKVGVKAKKREKNPNHPVVTHNWQTACFHGLCFLLKRAVREEVIYNIFR